MKLLIESGATKADWVFLEKGILKQQFQTRGMNPVAGFDAEAIKSEIFRFSGHRLLDQVNSLYFYGAGCTGGRRNQVIVDFFKPLLTDSAIMIVMSDILGVGRGLCGSEAATIGILGTGSLAACYDGENITEQSKSYGYLLSDEGSGYHIGKEVLRYLRIDQDSELERCRKILGLHSPEEIIQNIYNLPSPNRIIASYAKILSLCSDKTIARDILENCFHAYFIWHYNTLTSRQNNLCNFSGSIAFAFQDILKQVAKKFDCEILQIVKSPLEGLIAFHTK